MAINRIIELENWATGLREKLSLDDVIEAVKKRIHVANDEDRYQLALILKELLIETGRGQEALRLIDEMMVRLPDDVRFPIGRASLNLYFLNDLEEALTSIDEALARARQTGFFRREALGVKARILLKLGSSEQLSQILEEIMGLEMKDGVPDIGRERDFVDRAPSGLISEDVRTRYEEFCPERSDQ